MILIITALLLVICGSFMALFYDKNLKKLVAGLLLIPLGLTFAEVCGRWGDHLETTKQTLVSTESVACELVPFKVVFDEHDPEFVNATSPRYFIFTEDERYCSFYCKDLLSADEGFKMKTFLADNIIITYENDITPAFVKTTTVYDYSLNTFERILWYGIKFEKTTVVTYELQIPEASAPSS